MSKETILKEFENKLHNVYATIFQLSGYNEKQLKEKKDVMNIFISKAIDQTREETIKDAIRKIEKIKIAVVKQTGAYKYNSCYEDCIDILNKLKK